MRRIIAFLTILFIYHTNAQAGYYGHVKSWPDLPIFRNPNGVAVDNFGNVYVADTDNHRIQVFSSDGTFIRKWGSGSKNRLYKRQSSEVGAIRMPLDALGT